MRKSKAVQQLEADGFTDITLEAGGPKSCTQWYIATAPQGKALKADRVVLLRVGTAWHCFYCDFEGTGSGYSPARALSGGLGDVIGTDSQLRSYCRIVLHAPKHLLRLCDGLYRTSSNIYNCR